MRRSVPLTVTRITDRGTASVPTPAAGVCASIFGAAVATASAAPVPFRNFRREIFFFALDLPMEEYCSAVGARLTRNLEGGAHLNSQFRRIQEFTCAPPFPISPSPLARGRSG